MDPILPRIFLGELYTLCALLGKDDSATIYQCSASRHRYAHTDFNLYTFNAVLMVDRFIYLLSILSGPLFRNQMQHFIHAFVLFVDE